MLCKQSFVAPQDLPGRSKLRRHSDLQHRAACVPSDVQRLWPGHDGPWPAEEGEAKDADKCSDAAKGIFHSEARSA